MKSLDEIILDQKNALEDEVERLQVVLRTQIEALEWRERILDRPDEAWHEYGKGGIHESPCLGCQWLAAVRDQLRRLREAADKVDGAP